MWNLFQNFIECTFILKRTVVTGTTGRGFYAYDLNEQIGIRDRVSSPEHIGQFEDLIARHNLEAMYGYFAVILLLIGIFSLCIHAFLWYNKDTIIQKFPKTLGRYIQSSAFSTVVLLDLIFIGLALLTVYMTLGFLYREFIPVVVGIAADIKLGTAV